MLLRDNIITGRHRRRIFLTRLRGMSLSRHGNAEILRGRIRREKSDGNFAPLREMFHAKPRRSTLHLCEKCFSQSREDQLCALCEKCSRRAAKLTLRLCKKCFTRSREDQLCAFARNVSRKAAKINFAPLRETFHAEPRRPVKGERVRRKRGNNLQS